MRDFQIPNRSLVLAEHGMAATSHPLASKVALDILCAGGNAADAAISASLVLGVCEPHMTGLGGDCFALIKPAGADTVYGLNGSGVAPAGFDADRLRRQGLTAMPTDTGDAVTVPGAVAGFCALSERYGQLPLAEVLAPVIAYFEGGVPVAPRVAFDWAGSLDTLQGSAQDLYAIQGVAPRAGQVFRSPEQADVLRLIAAHGRAGFYEGAVAEGMVAALNAAGGTHTLDDFAAQTAIWVDPIHGAYKGTELIELPPNGQGATALLIANILAQHQVAAMDPRGVARIHLEAEAAKLAYDARNRIVGDPATAADAVARMTDPTLAADLAGCIDPKRAQPQTHLLTDAVHRDTVCLSVVDKDRMAVSMIYSIFHSFGSGLVAPESGILFQNRGAGFTLAEGHPNEARPGRRPMHTIIPGMLAEDGRVSMAFGVMGGQYQAAGHLRFLSNMVDFGMDPQTAIEFPRSFPENNVLKVERGYSDAQRAELTEMGHEVVIPDTPIGGAQAISLNSDGVLIGASDPRKDGCALGY
ncbi:MAG: gamma-glutamyltransferase family protein [Pseudomonadota bacterium]